MPSPSSVLATLRRSRVAAGASGVALGLVFIFGVRPPLAHRLTGLCFAPKEGPTTPPADAGPGVVVEEISFRARDGALLEGWWFEAAPPGGPRAVVLFAHGNGWNLERQWKHAARLVPLGFDVLAFDYRGFGDSPGRPSRRAAREDVLSALDQARDRGRAHGVPVVAVGQSMGAALVVEALAGRDDVAAIVADSPFSSWSEIAAWHLVETPWLRAPLRVVLASMLSATGTDPLQAAPRLKVPMLVIGGEEDDVTPPHMARALAGAANEGGVELLMLENAGHPGRRGDDAEALVTQAEAEFFARVIASR